MKKIEIVLCMIIVILICNGYCFATEVNNTPYCKFDIDKKEVTINDFDEHTLKLKYDKCNYKDSSINCYVTCPGSFSFEDNPESKTAEITFSCLAQGLRSKLVAEIVTSDGQTIAQDCIRLNVINGKDIMDPSIVFINNSDNVMIHKYQKYEVDYNDGGYPNTQIVYSVTGDLKIKEGVFSDNNPYVYVMTETGKGGILKAELVSESGEILASCDKEIKVPFVKRILYPIEGMLAAESIAAWMIGIISAPTILTPFYYIYQLIANAIE